MLSKGEQLCSATSKCHRYLYTSLICLSHEPGAASFWTQADVSSRSGRIDRSLPPPLPEELRHLPCPLSARSLLIALLVCPSFLPNLGMAAIFHLFVYLFMPKVSVMRLSAAQYASVAENCMISAKR
jgi:hypothetical protein